MHLSLEAIGLQAGDAVITTPYTFAATAEVIRYFNATPIFVDVEPDTCNIDPVRLAETLDQLSRDGLTINHSHLTSHNSKAIIPVHVAGLPARLDAIAALASQYKLAVIEDAAHAFPAQYRGRWIGSGLKSQEPDRSFAPADSDKKRGDTPSTSLRTGPQALQPAALFSERSGARSQEAGDNGHSPAPNHNGRPDSDGQSPFTLRDSQVTIPHTACFSFYATKTITTGEGGMITTADKALAERCRVMALHGISKDAWKRYTAEGSWYYEIIAPGYKYNMTDIAAAMGLAQLAKAERMWQRRREIARRYQQAFANVPALQVPPDDEQSRHAWHLYMLRLNLEQLKIDRSQFITALKHRNIGASVHFIPLHLQPYYRATYGFQPEDFPVATRQYAREVSLPIYSKMSDDDINDVIAAVLAIVARHRRPVFAGHATHS
jgi:dTDP-4-amino-4,6-dideoxygalactose transaminase